MADLLQLHTQDLADLMVELERDNSPGFRALYDLVASGRVYPLNEKELGPVRRKGTVFSRDEWASPILSRNIPFATLLSPDQVQRTLLYDIGGQNHYYFAPCRGSPELDGQAVMELLHNVSNPHYNKPGSILHMQSPSIERICQYKVDWPSDGVLGTSEVTVSVSSTNDFQDFEHHEDYILSTLLTGSKVWLAYPPLPHNIASLQEMYMNRVEHGGRFALDDLTEFQHGIALIQRVGQTLVIPPFWTFVSLSTQTSVSCAYHVATATVFPGRVKNIDNFLTITLRRSLGHADHQHRLVTFAAAMTEHLQVVLANNFQHYNSKNAIIEVCRSYETLRAGLRYVLDSIEDMAIVRGLEIQYRAAWLKFLDEKRKKRPACRLCNVRIENMPDVGTPADRLRQHFVDDHCLRANGVAQPVVRT